MRADQWRQSWPGFGLKLRAFSATVPNLCLAKWSQSRCSTTPGPQQSATQAQLEANSGEGSEKENQPQVVEEKAWCERGESNPHGFPRQILSLVRLPIPPLSHRGHNSLSRLFCGSHRQRTRSPTTAHSIEILPVF